MSKRKTTLPVMFLCFCAGVFGHLAVQTLVDHINSLPKTRVVECEEVTYEAHEATSLDCQVHGGVIATDRNGNQMFFESSVYATETVFDNVYQNVPMPNVFVAGDKISSSNESWMRTPEGVFVETECTEESESYLLMHDWDLTNLCQPKVSSDDFEILARISIRALEVPHP